MKKTISILIVSLLAAALLLVACKAPAATVGKPSESQPAAEGVGTVGGWTVFDDSTAYPIPDKAMDAFNRATDGYVGVGFKPIALIGTQVVAGTNYSILCLATPVVQNPVSHLAVVTVYEDVNGNATIKNVVDFNLGQIKDAETKAADPALVGGWAVPEEYKVINLPADAAVAFSKAADAYEAGTLEPLALLGSQVVAGMNYAVLCRETTDTGSNTVVAFIYAALDGTASVLSVSTLSGADFND